MSFSSGSYTPPSSSYPPVTGTKILVSKFVALIGDIATALSTCMLKDGTQTMTANLPMSSFKITGLGNGTAATDAANITNMVQNTGRWIPAADVTGTADAIALAPTPAITAYAAGQMFLFVAEAVNTGATTINVSGLGAKAYEDSGGALSGGDVVNGSLQIAVYNGTKFYKAYL